MDGIDCYHRTPGKPMGRAEFLISMKKRNKRAKKSWGGTMQYVACGEKSLWGKILGFSLFGWEKNGDGKGFSFAKRSWKKKSTNMYKSTKKTTHKLEQR